MRGATGGLKLRNLKGLTDRSRKTGGKVDQDDSHRNVERCWDHGKTGIDVKEKPRMAPPRRGIGDHVESLATLQLGSFGGRGASGAQFGTGDVPFIPDGKVKKLFNFPIVPHYSLKGKL